MKNSISVTTQVDTDTLISRLLFRLTDKELVGFVNDLVEKANSTEVREGVLKALSARVAA